VAIHPSPASDLGREISLRVQSFKNAHDRSPRKPVQARKSLDAGNRVSGARRLRGLRTAAPCRARSLTSYLRAATEREFKRAYGLRVSAYWSKRFISKWLCALYQCERSIAAFGWALLFLLVGIFEESLLRGYLQYTLSRGIGFWWAALLLSVVFALWHASNNGESLLGLLEVGLSGLYFCISLWYTKSLLWAVGFHAGWDWGQSYFYGTPDSGLVMKGHLLTSHTSGNPLWSGGATGPEGSLLILPLVIVMSTGMWIWWGRRKKASF
jgi:Type II CAAX prenyl endopeptidase Rce1-like